MGALEHTKDDLPLINRGQGCDGVRMPINRNIRTQASIRAYLGQQQALSTAGSHSLKHLPQSNSYISRKIRRFPEILDQQLRKDPDLLRRMLTGRAD